MPLIDDQHSLLRMKKALHRLMLLVAIIAFAACGGSKRSMRPVSEGRQAPPLEAPVEREKPPWEIWGLGRDLNGISIGHPTIRAGDTLELRGDYQGALAEFNAVATESLLPDEQRALIARRAGALLALGKYTDALNTVSRYFQAQNLGADGVDGLFALLLAFGYGGLGDIDQSLAWFGRADATPSHTPIYSYVAEKNSRALVQAIPPESFDMVFSKWKDDVRFGNLFQREKIRRSSPDYRPRTAMFAGGAFWAEQTAEGGFIGGPLSGGVSVGSMSIGVLLPLTGGFSVLGQETKNGIDLALDAEQEPRVSFVFKDDQGDPNLSQSVALELARVQKVNAMIGPLLSEPANVVRRVSLQTRVPQLSLSKGNVFETGDIVFRLGATSNSQMDTLLEACSERLNMTKFGLVYPESPVGIEYANSFKKYISAKGLELLYEGTYVPGDQSKFSEIAATLERVPVEGVFFPDTLEQARVFFGALSESFRDRARPLGPVTWDDPQALSQSQAVFRGALFVSPFFQGSANPLVRNFVERYTQKFGKKPDFLAAQGFDAATLAIGAARKTLSDGTPFDLALKEVEQYDGLTGLMRVDVSGEIQRTYAVVEARGGQLRALGTLLNEVEIGKEKIAQANPEGAPFQ